MRLCLLNTSIAQESLFPLTYLPALTILYYVSINAKDESSAAASLLHLGRYNVLENVWSILGAGILAMTEDYIIAIIQYILLMSGSKSRDCCH